MSENEAPRPLAASQTVAFIVLAIVLGGLVFAAFSFLTFGVPLLVVAVAGVIWMYVGIMKWADRLMRKRTVSPTAEAVSPPPSEASSREGSGGPP